jgi:hypothetical protein
MTSWEPSPTLLLKLEDGDILLFFYSGHGATLPVAEGSSFQQQRETWSLLDGRALDLEWDHLMGEFKSGVRLVLVSDSCYSGGFRSTGSDGSARDEGV